MTPAVSADAALPFSGCLISTGEMAINPFADRPHGCAGGFFRG